MPKFVYTGTDERTYPSLGVEATPGVVVDLPEAPTDGRWEPQTKPATTSVPAVETAPVVVPAPTNL